MNENSRSKKLLNKMHDHLDTIDVSQLSWSEKKDFLEVVQKGRFLETTGQVPGFGFGGFGSHGSIFNVPAKPAEPAGDADKAE